MGFVVKGFQVARFVKPTVQQGKEVYSGVRVVVGVDTPFGIKADMHGTELSLLPATKWVTCFRRP